MVDSNSNREELYGPPDWKITTKFFSSCYFYHENYNKLKELLETSKVEKIRIYSNILKQVVENFVS